MTDHCEPNDINLYCKTQFDSLKEDVGIIKRVIVGNGAVGYNVRIDRLEQARSARSKFEWLIIGCLTVILINSAWALTGKIISFIEHAPLQSAQGAERTK